MDGRRGWLGRDGWWRKKDWGFEVKFAEQTYRKFREDDNSEVHLRDVVQYVTHVQGSHDDSDLMSIRTDGGPFAILIDAMESSGVSLLPNLKSLDLQGNDFTEVGMSSLAKSLCSGKLPNLSRLDISHNTVGNEGAKSLGFVIRSGALWSLAELFLRNTRIGNEGLTALAESFQDGVFSLLPKLKSLDLQGNDFTEVGMSPLAKALSSGKLPNLSRLDISNNTVGNEGAKSLGFAIRSGALWNLAELFLRNTRIGNEGLTALAESLQEGDVSPLSKLKSLKSLDLQGNDFTEVGMSSLAESLSSGKLPNLSRLNISLNSIRDEGAKSLGIAIRSGKLKNLAELVLECTDIGDKGLTALAESFQDGVASLLPKLSSLDLCYNPFTEVGLLALAEVLKSGRLNLLKLLDVRNSDYPSKKFASALVSALLTNNCLTANVEFEWDKFPLLNRRRQQLIERNSRNRDILEGLVTVPKVQATFGKVYICGNPEVGKTTLCRTLQRSFWKSLFTWEGKPHLEARTRGIDVSRFSSTGSKPDENSITLSVWDMAGQEDFHLVHNAFFPDLGFAEGKATTFIVVCRSDNSPQASMEQLEYWLQCIASSYDKAIQNRPHVFIIMNNIGGDQKTHKDAEQWKLMLEVQRDKFEQHLQIQTKLFQMDVRKFKQVDSLKSCLLEHSRKLLRNQEVPYICQAIQKNLNVLNAQMEHFPVLHWKEFMEQVQQLLDYPWPEHIIEAAANYLNEAGVIIYIPRARVRLVVDPNLFCREVIGKVFLPKEMASPRELIFREQVDQSTGSISISRFKKFFNSLEGEWNDTQVDDMIAILLWLGLCYKGKDENVFIPALIARKGTPGGPWALQNQVEHGGDQWVMGFSVRHHETAVALAPVSLWHRFQVDLAQTLKFESETPDNDFVVDKHFMTFVKDYMNVLIEVDANLNNPTFKEISILIKPSFKREEQDAAQRKQWQVDLADDLVERLLKLWNQYCPGVEYVKEAIWPWPVSLSRCEHRTDRSVDVEKVKQWIIERGIGREMQWQVCYGDSITLDQLLSTKDKNWFASLKTSGIKGRYGKGSKVLGVFLTEVNNRGGEGYFLSKKWLHTLTEHEVNELMLALWGNGYLEIYATHTMVFYERMEEHVQVCSIYNDPSRTPENNDLCFWDKNKSEPLDHVVASSKIEQKRFSTTKHDGTLLDSDLSTLSLDNNTKLAVGQVSETSPTDSPSSLPKKREKPSTNSHEKLNPLTRAVKDRSLYNFAVSTHWLSTLNDHEREDLNSALSEAGYSELYKTSTTTYFEKIQGRIRTCPAHERDTASTSASRNIGDDTENSGLFQGHGNSIADDQGGDVGGKGAFVVIEERPKISARCECLPQCLTVSIFDRNFTPIHQSAIGPITSSSHGEHLSRSSSRQRVGDCFVTFPKNRKGHVIATSVDKEISMTTFTFNAAGVPSQEILSVNVSAGTSLTSCIRSDHDNKKVKIKFSKINGAANMEGSVDPRENALALRSVRTNVHARIVYSESEEDFEEISLVFEEEYTRRPWRRLLNDCMSLAPSETRPKHSEQESLTLELQGDVLRRLVADVEKCSRSAYCLSFVGCPPAIMEGDIHGNLHRNSFLELQIRYQVEASFPEPCEALPSSEIEFVEIKRVPHVFDFDCIVEMRTQSLYNPGT